MTAARRRSSTIRDVAERAATSRSTASRALTGRGHVAAQVRERVLAAADELSYVPDAMARSLKQRHSRLVGLIVSDLRNPFYADLAAGTGMALRARGYDMVLADMVSVEGAPVADELAAARAFAAMRVAGVLVTPASGEAGTFLEARGIPVVEVDRRFSPRLCDAVLVDNAAAATRMTEHLIALGHRRIALFIDETSWTTGHDRLKGYRAALRRAGVGLDPALVVRTGWSAEDARVAALRLLATHPRPTALFAANNVLAEGIWRAVAEAGLRVPQDVSLAAFDDVQWMSMVVPGLSAVAQDVVGLGATACELLLHRVGGTGPPAPSPSAPCSSSGTQPVRSRGSKPFANGYPLGVGAPA